MRSASRLAVVLLTIGALLLPGDLPATASTALRPVRPVMDCADVTGLNLPGVTIRSATVTSAGAPSPYCAVEGVIAPADTIVMRLPVNGWTQRYLQTGCGGLCGTARINYTQAAACAPVADGTIASATTDMGHQGQNDGSWAAGNPQAQIDFAYRGVHETARVAKEVITRFYGRPPAYSYFSGCSDGGREALMEAQRYPDDFDGIVAGAPASNLVVQNTFHHAWNVLANRDAAGNYILLAGRLPLIHDAVMAACDRLDGLADGVLDDPRRCRFDPYSLVCDDPATCLTRAEAAVVRRLHDGAVTSRGVRLEQEISHEWGSELDWTLFVPAAQGQVTFSENIALSFLRYLAYFNVADPDYQLTDLEFTEESFWRTVQTSKYLSATDPDLSRFRRSGGKLILWHGWSDQHISPQATLNYYEALGTPSYARLFLFPGLAHCSGGLGPDTFDIMTPMLNWVEKGTAPTSVVATKGARSRPVYPYPAVARYDGTGSTDDAANFVPVIPRTSPKVNYDWLGAGLYTHGYQTTCQPVNGKLLCAPSHPIPHP
ncbi:feruloyl esterase [Actinoplanes campanulatus]|uniref:Feruloyl esterase n=1 Tax=Actinoplanes campanulatus TaxID=113559 RepID=A0A7W5AF43_9ACTN|nr:tannase/feruloyl esterase family alpha/beta hydrolase [Actinoplanes campanulatus]MBB3095177.1 feruloyl esterase [Actinoplanes campanulatus]GGN23963.1 feruloyl esterase [Actinoplanes campanulatus]GID34781.1 feruloyl esterase [Actinoplanes campanulatus]